MTDLTDRLRAHAKLRTAMDGDNGNTAMLREAADEIDRLSAEVARLEEVEEAYEFAKSAAEDRRFD